MRKSSNCFLLAVLLTAWVGSLFIGESKDLPVASQESEATSTPVKIEIIEREIPTPPIIISSSPAFSNRFTGEATISSTGLNYPTDFSLDKAGRLRVKSDPMEGLNRLFEPLPLTLVLNSGTQAYTFTTIDESHRVNTNERTFIVTLHYATSTSRWGRLVAEWRYGFDISEIPNSTTDQ